MAATRLDAVSRFLAQRRLSRRQALSQGGAGLPAGALAAARLPAVAVAQEATPDVVTLDAGHSPTMLFVQSFQSGSIAPKEGAEGRYTVTLEHGLGRTIYFSDRPDRIVGASPTPQFLEGLGFADDNPPNAALVVERAPGETDIAVVELFAPVYDPAGPSVTYEVEALENWEDTLEVGFTAAPTDLASLALSFGTAHLFIDGPLTDGCAMMATVTCNHGGNVELGDVPVSVHLIRCVWTSASPGCEPVVWGDRADAAISAATSWCNEQIDACNGKCGVGISCVDTN